MACSLRRQAGKQNLRNLTSDEEHSQSPETEPQPNVPPPAPESSSNEDQPHMSTRSRSQSRARSQSPSSTRASVGSLWDLHKNRSTTSLPESSATNNETHRSPHFTSAFSECLDQSLPSHPNEIPLPEILARDTCRMHDIDFDRPPPNDPQHQFPGFTSVSSFVSDGHHEDDYHLNVNETSIRHLPPPKESSRDRYDSVSDEVWPELREDFATGDQHNSDSESSSDGDSALYPLWYQRSAMGVYHRANPSSATLPKPPTDPRPSPTRTASSSALPTTALQPFPTEPSFADLIFRSPELLGSPPSSPSPSPALLPEKPPPAPKPKARVVMPPPAVVVRVPVADPTKTPSRLWESDSRDSSLPIMPWGDSKRWQCCRCGARTIVEQAVCARLVCGHARCEDVVCQTTMVRDRVAADGKWVQVR